MLRSSSRGGGARARSACRTVAAEVAGHEGECGPVGLDRRGEPGELALVGHDEVVARPVEEAFDVLQASLEVVELVALRRGRR